MQAWAPPQFIRSIVAGVAAALTCALVAAACTSDEVAAVTGISVADGFAVSEAVTDLSGPTQVSSVNDGAWLLVAELNGGESDGTGRILSIPAPDQPTERTVVLEDLQKPTGLAVIGNDLWVMEERRLSRAPLGEDELTVVLDDLPFNGRSSTTLSVDADGSLLYGTTGRLIDGVPQDGSGALWRLDPATDESTLVGTGFKNPYAHLTVGDGPLVTEMSDGSFDGEPAPDELVRIVPGDDHGWPMCIGDRIPVEEFGGTVESCTDGPPSHAVFAPGATPTSLVLAPWDPNTVLVALWSENRVVSVPLSPEGAPHEPVTFMDGDLTPQHLFVDGDRLLVVDFDGDRILAVEPT